MKLIELTESSAESIRYELAMWNKYLWDLMDSDLILPMKYSDLKGRGFVKVGRMHGPEDDLVNVFVKDTPENQKLIVKLQKGFQREEKLVQQLNNVERYQNEND